MLPTESKIVYLTGERAVFEKNVFSPFDGSVCDFLVDFSADLFQDPIAKALSDVMTFAFFCRRTNLAKLKKEHSEEHLRLGLGTVFHISPSNVPVNFAYSYIFGLLAGNANIVRVPSKPFPQVDAIVSSVKRVLSAEKYAKLRNSTAFVRYEQDNLVTAAFSKLCNARVIWGGDETIREIREIPISVSAVDITFADRYSFCIMNAGAVCRMNEIELQRLANGFFNDTYLVDQNACSSPHLIVWLGDSTEAAAASSSFWQSLYEEVGRRYMLQPVTAVDKLTQLCENAIYIPNISSVKRYENLLYVITLSSLPERPDELRGSCGYFYEYYASALDEMAPAINEKYQTVTYYGIPKEVFVSFALENRPPGVDRFVPVGSALDISTIWDGYDLIKTLSRIVDIR
jgi:hypothetical protein